MSSQYYIIDGELNADLQRAFGWELFPKVVFEQLISATIDEGVFLKLHCN